MQCKGKFIRIFAVLVLAIVALSFSFQGPNEAVNPRQAHFVPDCEFVKGHFIECKSSADNQISNPMDRVFQIIFILFFISPPLIVILLFLIWCEMKKRNDHQ
jgi:hypothetical protein